MGDLKDELLQHSNWKKEVRLAELLGIRYDEFEQTDWEIEEQAAEDGSISKILVRFNESSPAHILEKINGLDANHSILVDASALEEGQDESEEFYEEGEGEGG
jgi:hypothetical protein